MTLTSEDLTQLSAQATNDGKPLVTTAVENGFSSGDITTAALLDHVHAAAATPVDVEPLKFQ